MFLNFKIQSTMLIKYFEFSREAIGISNNGICKKQVYKPDSFFKYFPTKSNSRLITSPTFMFLKLVFS